MNWHSWSEFLAMGGYALYVWGSYAVTLVAAGADPALAWACAQTLGRSLG